MSNKHIDWFKFTVDCALQHSLFFTFTLALYYIQNRRSFWEVLYNAFNTRLRGGSPGSFTIGMTAALLPITPSLSSAYCVIVHERIYNIRRCYKGRPTSSRQPPRATVAEKAASHSCSGVRLRQVTMLPSYSVSRRCYLRASFLSKQQHLEAVFAANKLHRSARIMLKFESNARGCC